MSDDEVRITLRLPAGLRDRIQEAAEKNSRSMNGEIVARLTGDGAWHDHQLGLDLLRTSAAVRSFRLAIAEYHLSVVQAAIKAIEDLQRLEGRASSESIEEIITDFTMTFSRLQDTQPPPPGDDLAEKLFEVGQRLLEKSHVDP